MLFRPSIPDNVVNWRVFDHDEQLIEFLTMKDTFKDAVIDEMTHDEDLYNFAVIHKPCSIEESLDQVSTLPRYVIKLEKFYDLKDKFKGARNCKTNNSTMQFEVINLGTEHSPQCVNLGSTCTPQEKTAFI